MEWILALGALTMLCPRGDDERIQKLIEDLRSADVEVRARAEEGLLKSRTEARPFLEKAARDKDLEVASRAARLLRLFDTLSALTPNLRKIVPKAESRLKGGGDRAVTELFLELVGPRAHRPHPELLREDLEGIVADAARAAQSPREKRRICEIVLRWDLHGAAPELVRFTRDPDDVVRREAMNALVGIHAEEAIPHLLPGLKDENQTIRASAVRGLAALGSQEARPEIIQLLGDDRDHVRRAVKDALIELGPEKAIPHALSLLGHKGTFVREDAMRFLARIGAKEAVPKIAQLVNGQASEDVALDALAALKAHEELFAFLKHPRKDIRTAVLRRIKKRGIREAAPHALPLLSDPEETVRSSAAEALAEFKVEAARPKLLELLKSNSNYVRRSALWALTSLGEKSLVPLALEDMKSDQSSVRKRGARILWALRAPEAVPELLKLLEDSDSTVRRMAILLLDDFEDPAIAPAIEKRLQDPDSYVRLSTIGALGRLGRKEAVPRIEKFLEEKKWAFRQTAVVSLSRLGERSLAPRFVQLLESDEFVSPWDLGLALRRLGAKEVIPDLVRLLAHESKRTRYRAVVCLELLDDRQAIEPVSKLLKDPDIFEVRRMAARYLATRGDKRAVPALLEEPADTGYLNAMRAPKAWKRLSEKVVSREFRGPPLAVFRYVAAEAGLTIENEALLKGRIFGLRAGTPRPSPENRDTLLEALFVALAGDLSFVLEEDRIRLMSLSRAHVFWRRWWHEQREK